MQKNSIQTLSRLAVPLKSKGRFFNEKKTHLRSDFQRDRDRIIHSTAFRRLKHKTQVFVNTSSDHFRTRITHSLEVAQIARTLSKSFNLNEDLCETISLAHDLGHTPFGHAGEEELNNCMKIFGGFDHNIQTLRTILFLENRYYEFKGLNLTLETLDGLLKHNGPIKNIRKYKNILGFNYFRNKINYSLSPSLEAQIASISDDVAYNSHDLEDGLKSNLFNIKNLEDIPILRKIIQKHKRKEKKYSIDLIIRQIIREIINEMVIDIINTTKKNIIKYKIKNLTDVYNCRYPIVTFSKKMKIFDKKIKSFLRKKMYYHKDVKANTNKGKRVIKRLFLTIKKNPKRYINVSKYDKSNIARSICDYIAGMTDRYAINLYKNIK